MSAPLLLSVAFSDETPSVVDTAITLAKHLGAPLATVHALGWRPMETEAQLTARIEIRTGEVLEALAPAVEAGIELLDPVVARGRPSDLVVETAGEVGAALIVTGGGGTGSLRRWLIGSVAESIVRASNVPVFVARGDDASIPGPVLCPVDFSPHALAGLQKAADTATRFQVPLVVLTVVPEAARAPRPERVDRALPQDVETARKRLTEVVATMDLSCELEHRVVVADDAGDAIVDAAAGAWLVVMATRSFGELRTEAVGAFTERVLRHNRRSALVVRVSPVDDDRSVSTLRQVGRLRLRAEEHLAAGRAEAARSLLEVAVGRARGNAALHDRLADVLDSLERSEEAAKQRSLAALIRKELE